MKRLLLTFFIINSLAFSQAGSSAVPFLLIGNSLSGNGMGEIRASTNTSSALMGTFNPGLLGVQSFTQRFNSELYTQKTLWLPIFNLSDLYLISNAVTIGTQLNEYYDLPYPISFGIGYSNTYLNLGEFVVTTEKDPTPVGIFHGYERVDVISVGSAIQYGATYGLGLNIKRIYSQLSPIGTAEERGKGIATPFAFDLGTFIEIPIIKRFDFSNESNNTISFYPNLSTSVAYVYSNIGGSINYGDPSQSDPLPREITMGYTISGGIDMNFLGADIDLVSAQFIRESEDLAVKRTSSTDWSFQYGLGDIRFYDNLMAGKYSENSTLRKGFELQLFNLVTFRKGSNKMEARDFFKTEGFEMNITGVFRYIYILNPDVFDNTLMKFVYHHLDLRLIKSSYTGTMILSGSSFEGITVRIK
jgi:hypothetical protein